MSCLLADFTPLPMRAVLVDILLNVWISTENQGNAPAVKNNPQLREFIKESFEGLPGMFMPISEARSAKGMHKLGSTTVMPVDDDGEPVAAQSHGVAAGLAASGNIEGHNPADVERWRKIQFAELAYVFKSLLPCVRLYMPALEATRDGQGILRVVVQSVHSFVCDVDSKMFSGAGRHGWVAMLEKQEAEELTNLSKALSVARSLAEGRWVSQLQAIERVAQAAIAFANAASLGTHAAVVLERRRTKRAVAASETTTDASGHTDGFAAARRLKARLHPDIIAAGYARFLALMGQSEALTTGADEEFDMLVEAVVNVEARVRERVPEPGIRLMGGTIRRLRAGDDASSSLKRASSSYVGGVVVPLAEDEVPCVRFEDIVERFVSYSSSRRSGVDVTQLTIVFRLLRRIIDRSGESAAVLENMQNKLVHLGVTSMIFTQLCIARKQPMVRA